MRRTLIRTLDLSEGLFRLSKLSIVGAKNWAKEPYQTEGEFNEALWVKIPEGLRFHFTTLKSLLKDETIITSWGIELWLVEKIDDIFEEYGGGNGEFGVYDTYDGRKVLATGDYYRIPKYEPRPTNSKTQTEIMAEHNLTYREFPDWITKNNWVVWNQTDEDHAIYIPSP